MSTDIAREIAAIEDFVLEEISYAESKELQYLRAVPRAMSVEDLIEVIGNMVRISKGGEGIEDRDSVQAAKTLMDRVFGKEGMFGKLDRLRDIEALRKEGVKIPTIVD